MADLPLPLPLSVSSLTYTYPDATDPAVVDVDVTAHAGECVALLGPNGAGKTTTIAAITGLTTPQQGIVRIAGGDPRHATTRLALGVMLQQTAFPPHLTVGELIEGAAIRSGRSTADAATVMAEVGLTELRDRRSKKLSGGQQRRLGLARALVTDPILLVLDEPTEGLDTESRRTFWDNLAARRDKGMAILLTTHLIEEAGAVADRVTVIAGGRVVADEPPAVLANRLPDRRITIRTRVGVAEVAGWDAVEHASLDSSGLTSIVTSTPEAILRRLLPLDPSATDLRVEGASLEDAVMALSHTRPVDPPGIDLPTDPDPSTTSQPTHA